MGGLEPPIHRRAMATKKLDGRVKPGHGEL